MFTSFSIFFFFSPHCSCGEYVDVFKIYSKINTSTWITFSDPKQKDESTSAGAFPRLPSLALHQNIPCASIFFFIYSQKKVKIESLNVHCAVTTLV